MVSGFLWAIEDGRMRRLASGQGESGLDAVVGRVPTFWAVTLCSAKSTVPPQCFPHKVKRLFA